MAWCAGVLTGSLATCPNMALVGALIEFNLMLQSTKGGVQVWLSVWSEVQTCIRPS